MKRKIHHWTEEDRDIIRQYYNGTLIESKRLASLFGVTPRAVSAQASKMALTNCITRWTEWEEEYLENNYGKLSLRKLAARLHRSTNAIHVKARKMGLTPKGRDGWYTLSETCEILGAYIKKVRGWINTGILQATTYESATKFGGSSTWYIDEYSIRKFILKYPHELTGRNVDIQQIVWILNRK